MASLTILCFHYIGLKLHIRRISPILESSPLPEIRDWQAVASGLDGRKWGVLQLCLSGRL